MVRVQAVCFCHHFPVDWIMSKTLSIQAGIGFQSLLIKLLSFFNLWRVLLFLVIKPESWKGIMRVLNWAVFGKTSPVNAGAHLPAQGKDKHFLLAAKCRLQSKCESSENVLLFSLLTRLDESNLHRGCLIGRGAHLWAALADCAKSLLVHFVWRLPSPREGKLDHLQCPHFTHFQAL